MKTLTAANITEAEIRTLRHEASDAGDAAQLIICDVALGEAEHDLADYALAPHERIAARAALDMTQDEAQAACAAAINDARAQ